MAYNILIVDDSSVIRKALKKTLLMTNLEFGEVKEAENGKQALEALKECWIDLIFLDINMPEMNGIEFMHALRRDTVHKDTAVVIVSTEGSNVRAQELRELGVKAQLRKPVRPEVLSETVLKVLGVSDK